MLHKNKHCENFNVYKKNIIGSIKFLKTNSNIINVKNLRNHIIILKKILRLLYIKEKLPHFIYIIILYKTWDKYKNDMKYNIKICIEDASRKYNFDKNIYNIFLYGNRYNLDNINNIFKYETLIYTLSEHYKIFWGN